MTQQIQTYPNLEALSAAAADLFRQVAELGASEDRPATIALSGGSTPRRMFELLAAPPRRDLVPWGRVQLFMVDERPVPANDPQSNYRLLRETLLQDVPLPSTSIHRIPTEKGTPEQAAAAYDLELKATLPRVGDGWPRFDLIFLGMGDDGHTASLFPHSPALEETARWVVANPVEKLGQERITLTFPVINHAARVAFLVSGASKAETLRRVLTGPPSVDDLPAQGIHPTNGRLTWLLDEPAASQLG